jgi:hypothetical protein
MKKKTDKKDKIIETLYTELERKDKLIEKLREENKILIRTALKNAEKLKILEEKINMKLNSN